MIRAAGPGIVREGDEIVRVRPAPDATLAPKNFDLDLEFDVDVMTVQESVGLSGGSPSRPWDPLDRRLFALIKAVHDYTDGLLAIAAEYVQYRDLEG